MTRRLVVRREAEDDIAAVLQWYEEQQKGLSLDFRTSLDHVFASIAANPELYGRIYRQLRRALLPRFPYGVFYVIQPESTVIVAVLHTSRNPKLWRDRTKNRG